MNKEERDKIMARCETATPGPWVCKGAYIHRERDINCIARVKTWHNPFETAVFIAHAREDIPKLLDDYDALEADRDRWKERAETLEQWLIENLGYCQCCRECYGKGIVYAMKTENDCGPSNNWKHFKFSAEKFGKKESKNE